MKSLPILILISILISCNSYQRKERKQGNATIKFDLQGHRGARGLAPENSIPGFWKALSLGVSTLEMDLTVTKDKELVVSHEPWFSHIICRDSIGRVFSEEEARTYNIYEMSYNQISKFDCGSKSNPNFPNQESVSISKPKFVDVVNSTEQFTSQRGSFPVNYNIEIKSSPEGDNIYHPNPEEFSDLVFQAIDGLIQWNRVTIQSFDFRILQYFHTTYPNVRLAVLIENNKGVDSNLETLGFHPPIYSCNHRLLSKETIAQLHEKEIDVIPWTVNEMSDMERLFDWGVDGLITDYPNRFWESKIDPREVIEFD